MAASKQPFIMENCVLVTNNSATIDDLRKFIRDNLESVLLRGNSSLSKLMILSGCHGTPDGRDGINSLECLSKNENSPRNETRKFYEEMCLMFDLSPQGDDPRVYDDISGKVVGVKSAAGVDWKERAPNFLYGSWMSKLNIENVENAKLMFKIIDVAAFHENIEELKEEIVKFDPSILVVDWCHNLDGFTVNHLKASGLVSNIVLRNEEFLRTKRQWIQLSQEQQKVLQDARTMKLRGGEVFFIHGCFGSGKTVVGIEVARILASRRKLDTPDKKVQTIFTAPEPAEFLLNYHQNSSFTMEKKDTVIVIGIEPLSLFDEEDLESVSWQDCNQDPVSVVNKVAYGLKTKDEHYVIVIDELGFSNQNWTNLQMVEYVDLIILPKLDHNSKKQIIPPNTENGVNVYHLTKSYRQSFECLRAHQYIQSHAWNTPIPNSEDFIFDRLPSGEPPVWIACEDENVTEEKAFEKVREMLAGETSVLVFTYDKEIEKYCEELEWTAGDSYFGFEADVSFANEKRLNLMLFMT